MYFTEEQIQKLNWRTDLVELSNTNGWLLHNELSNIPDMENWQWVPGNGAVIRLVKCSKGYFLVSGGYPMKGQEQIFKFHKLNKWGF